MASSPAAASTTTPADGAGASSVRLAHIARNTLVVAGAFGLAAVAGLFRNIVIAYEFGIGANLDAYYAAFRLPDLLFTIVAGGALATAFIPVFAEFLAHDDRAGAWRLASAITNVVVVVVSVLAVLVGITAPWLVRTFIAPGFDAAQQAETVAVMRVVLVSIVLFGISAVQSSVLHGFKHFLLPALAPALYPLGIALGAIVLGPRLGILGLAVGAVIGSALHLAVKVPGLIYYGFRWWPVFDLRSTAVRQVGILMGPRILDLLLFHGTLLVTTNLASRLGAGSVSALEWGWDAMQLPETIIGTAIGLVAFPTLAELAARRDIAGLRSTLGNTMRAVIALAVPAAVGLILLGQPLLSVLYERGAFDASATEAVVVALRFYALGLVSHTILELVARAFFAQKNTITPLLVAAAAAALNIVLALLLMGPLDYGGLALANSAAVTVEVIVLLMLLRPQLHGVQGRQTLAALGRVLVAAALMGLAVSGVLALAPQLGLAGLPMLLFAAAVGAVVYGIAALVLGITSVRRLWTLLTLRSPPTEDSHA